MASAVKEMKSDDLVLIARVDARDDQGLEEAEEAWDLRDAGYDAVWVSDVLYKFGSFSGTCSRLLAGHDHVGGEGDEVQGVHQIRAGVRAPSGKGEGRQLSGTSSCRRRATSSCRRGVGGV